MVFPMDDMHELHLRMRISNLQARVELCEIEILALSREILSPLTTSQRQAEADARRDDLMTERSELAKKLDGISRSFAAFDRSGSHIYE
jgi:hypothetical protein